MGGRGASLEHVGWLFRGESSSPIPLTTIKGRWIATTKAVGVTSCTSTPCAPLLRLRPDRGCDYVTVQRALGHKSPSVTLDTYSHLWPTAEDRTRASSGRLAASALGLATPCGLPRGYRARDLHRCSRQIVDHDLIGATVVQPTSAPWPRLSGRNGLPRAAGEGPGLLAELALLAMLVPLADNPAQDHHQRTDGPRTPGRRRQGRRPARMNAAPGVDAERRTPNVKLRPILITLGVVPSRC